jgi:regulatory protein
MTFTPKYPPFETRARIKAWCDRQERAHSDVVKKLKTWNVAADDIDQIVSELISGNYLNEERFAKAYASGKFNISKWGWTKIEYGLKQKQVSSYSISLARAEMDQEDILSTLDQLLRKKASFVKSKSVWERNQKLYKFARGRGFDHADIKRILDRDFFGE